MFRRVLASGLLAVLPLLAIPIAMVSTAPPVGATTPPSIKNCMNGGWQSLTNAAGQPFANQGQCISFAIHNPVNLADLAGTSVTGTTFFTPFSNGCSFVFQEFDAAYSGSATVGTVNLHIAGCVNSSTTNYAGSFSLTTAAGIVAGSAAGPITETVIGGSVVILDYQVTLTVSTATGAFSGMTGTLHFLTMWDVTHAPPTFSGSVTVP
jgi:hypothetical protein